MSMEGRRRYPDEFGVLSLGSGDYGRDSSGKWVLYPPGHGAGMMHPKAVTEEKNGTISVAGLIIGGEWIWPHAPSRPQAGEVDD